MEDIAIDPEYADMFIQNFQAIYSLGQKSQRFFLKMMSIPSAFESLLDLDNLIEK